MKKRHSEEQIIRIRGKPSHMRFRSATCAGRTLYRNEPLYRWPGKYGEMDVVDAPRLKELESKNGRFNHLMAERTLVIDWLKAFSRKKMTPAGQRLVLEHLIRQEPSQRKTPLLAGREPTRGVLRVKQRDKEDHGGALAGGITGDASVWLPSDGGPIGPRRVAGTPGVAPDEIEHPTAQAVMPPLGQRHPLPWRGAPQRGLALRLRSRPYARRT